MRAREGRLARRPAMGIILVGSSQRQASGTGGSPPTHHPPEGKLTILPKREPARGIQVHLVDGEITHPLETILSKTSRLP